MFFTVRNSSCGKVMFSQTSVILSRGGVWQTPPRADSPGQTLPRRWPLQRTVRILLECIFVHLSVHRGVGFPACNQPSGGGPAYRRRGYTSGVCLQGVSLWGGQHLELEKWAVRILLECFLVVRQCRPPCGQTPSVDISFARL